MMDIDPVVATYGSLIEMEEIGNSRESILNLLDSQKALFHSQINEFHRIVNHQCKLTGTNPLAQDMVAISLGHKTGKRLKDSLNPKAMKYLQSVFSIKDTTGKKETREISAVCRITVTQVRDFFNTERSKVKKLVQQSERIASDISKAVVIGCSTPNQTQCSGKNEHVTNITPQSTPNNRIVENGTSSSSNQGIVTSTSSQSPITPEIANLFSTESVGSPSSFIQGFTWDSEKSGTVIIPWDSEIDGNSEYSQTEHMQIPGNLEKGSQENVGNFDDLYTPLSWCPGNSNNFGTDIMKANTSFTNVCTDITNANSNTSNVSRNVSNVSTNTASASTTITNVGVNIFKNNVIASSVQDGQFPIYTDPTPGVDSSDKEFVEKIFSMMRKEQTFSGRVKLMEWVLQIQNKAVLSWFSTKGGITILASWLNDAAHEEQTTVLSVIFKVFCHMPLDKAQPTQMSDILQAVNKLRFYRNPDISQRAKVLLSSWSKAFVRSQALKNARNRLKNGPLPKRKNGALYDKLNLDIPEEIYAFAQDAEAHRGIEPEPGNGLKLLTSSSDTLSKKHELSISAKKTKERRKVQLVEHPDSKLGRNTPIAKASSSNQSRPLSADDIKKAKMRAMYMQEKHGKANSPTENGQLNDGNTPPAVKKPPLNNQTPPTFNAPQPSRLRINEITKSPQERLMEKLTRVQIQWCRPPEVLLRSEWHVCSGQNSKEVQNQIKRTQREQESNYQTAHQIPPNPKEPWDSEMDYDDTLTPVIPIDSPSEANSPSDAAIEEHVNITANDMMPAAVDFTAADPELLQVLLKNPQLVETLTREGPNLTQQQLMALLELVKKADSAQPVPVSVSRPISVPRPVSIPKPELEAQHYSLPSPTPPSDATRKNWRSEFPTHNITSQLVHSRSVPVVQTAQSTSQYMTLPISISQAQFGVPKTLANNHISQNSDYAPQHLPMYQPNHTLLPSNYYQASDSTRIMQKPHVQYLEQPPQPTIPDCSRREFMHRSNQVVVDDGVNANGVNMYSGENLCSRREFMPQPGCHLKYYYANQNNSNNANGVNMYSRTNEYAPRVGPPEIYVRGRLDDQSNQNYGNRVGEKRLRDPYFQ